MITLFFKTWSLWIMAALMGFAGLQTVRLEHSQNKAVGYEARVATQDAERERVHAADQALARAKESDLAAVAETTRKAADDAIQTSNLRIAALTDSLRNRPSRVATSGSGATQSASPGQGSTGAGLYREDGVFLAGEAAAAAQVRG